MQYTSYVNTYAKMHRYITFVKYLCIYIYIYIYIRYSNIYVIVILKICIKTSVADKFFLQIFVSY